MDVKQQKDFFHFSTGSPIVPVEYSAHIAYIIEKARKLIYFLIIIIGLPLFIYIIIIKKKNMEKDLKNL
jgi:hypothetical protein